MEAKTATANKSDKNLPSRQARVYLYAVNKKSKNMGLKTKLAEQNEE